MDEPILLQIRTSGPEGKRM